MKISSGLEFKAERKLIKCTQCSSSNIESLSHTDSPENGYQKSPKIESISQTSYLCHSCGHHFTSKDLEDRSVFRQGIMTLFFIFIMIVSLLIVLL